MEAGAQSAVPYNLAGTDVSIFLVALDFDNVLVPGSHHMVLAQRVGRAQQMEDLFTSARLGQIPVEKFVREAAGLLSGLSVRALHETIPMLPLRLGAKDLVRRLRRTGVPVVIISHGVLQWIEASTASLDVDAILARRLLEYDGILTGNVDEAMLSTADKLRALEREAARRGITLAHCAAVGDGANDYDMLAGVGIPIGFNPVDVLTEIPDLHIVTGDSLNPVANVLLQKVEENTH